MNTTEDRIVMLEKQIETYKSIIKEMSNNMNILMQNIKSTYLQKTNPKTQSTKSNTKNLPTGETKCIGNEKSSKINCNDEKLAPKINIVKTPTIKPHQMVKNHVNNLNIKTHPTSHNENSSKHAKFDFTKSATLITPITDPKELNQLVNMIGREKLEFDINIPNDKPFQMSMIFKNRIDRDQIIDIYNKNQKLDSIMSKNYEINNYTIQTQCKQCDINILIGKMITHKTYIDSYLISKPIEGKYYIKINGKNDNSVIKLLEIIPDSQLYKSREILIAENELKVSMSLDPKIYTDKKAHSVLKTLCKLANITYSKSKTSIIYKSKTISHSNDETTIIKLMRIHYTTNNIQERNAIIATRTPIKAQKGYYFRGMTSNAEFFKNLPTKFKSSHNTLNSHNHLTTLERKTENIGNSITKLSQSTNNSRIIYNNLNEQTTLIAGTRYLEEERKFDGTNEKMIISNTTND